MSLVPCLHFLRGSSRGLVCLCKCTRKQRSTPFKQALPGPSPHRKASGSVIARRRSLRSPILSCIAPSFRNGGACFLRMQLCDCTPHRDEKDRPVIEKRIAQEQRRCRAFLVLKLHERCL